MKRLVRSACAAAAVLAASTPAAAQDIAITNARIIVGSGQVIDPGTIIVRGGKIVSVTAGAAPTQGLRTIDAKGMSAMPGFIDGHKHVNNFNAAQMKSLLEAGYTTVLSGGGQADQNVALRDRIDKGEFVGPRVIPSGQIMGPNSARYVGMADQIGTLEPGKLADIILIDGNPTLNIYEMLKTKVVLKEGKVVVDKR
jgi:imidazolonepropionase-like amidohydrolase